MRDERGHVSVEAALLAPVIILLVGLAVVGGRLWLARAQTESAAGSAARAATLARTAGEASVLAGETARRNLGDVCSSTAVSVDTGAFGTQPGTPAVVTARVSCTVPLADVALPGMPGSITVVGVATSPLDTYRER